MQHLKKRKSRFSVSDFSSNVTKDGKKYFQAPLLMLNIVVLPGTDPSLLPVIS